jgi:hypothetical protein
MLMRDFYGWDARALWEDINWDAKHQQDVLASPPRIEAQSACKKANGASGRPSSPRPRGLG